MKKNSILSCTVYAFIIALSLHHERLQADRTPAAFSEKRFTINLEGGEIRDVLKLIAAQGQVKMEIEESVSGNVSYSFTDVTLESALKTIAKDHNLVYYFEDGVVYIEKGALDNTSSGPGGVYTIGIKNSNAKYIFDKLPKLFRSGESLIVDETANSLIFYGGETSRKKLMNFIEAFDQTPTQILIEAQIIETSKNFIRDIGFKWGEPSGNMELSRSARGTGQINTGAPSNPNITGKFLLGFIDSRALEAHVIAAESSGNAKIISRPKVITLNNQVAKIQSGVTFHIKTLSSTTTANGEGNSETVTGGLQSVTAGMQLQVLPVVVGNDLIKLQLTVTNSEPDDSLAVDGIPGIVNNSANTTVIVRDGNTAALAGLIKTTLSKAHSQVPFLSHIPILGWLFRSHSDKDLNKELVIFITPKIVSIDAVKSSL